MTRPHQTSSTPIRTRHQRRGTILLMVVGVLALLSIITIVYVTLGRSDRVQSSAVVRTQRLNDQAGEIAEYLTRILARDMFSTYVERDPSDPTETKTITRRELWDYPSTDPDMRSSLLLTTRPQTTSPRSSPYLFNPEGTVSPVGLPNDLITRQPSDPFLAASEPSRIPIDAGTNNAFPGLNEYDKWYRQQRDWTHISVVSPSGNPVNLVNLRNNFNIDPGFGTRATQPDQFAGMSQRLGLFDRNGVMKTAANNQLPDALQNILEKPMETSAGWVWDKTIRLNQPADWSNDQFTLFRPMVDGFDPGDARHITNQFADADGDGFADSRWSELVDISFQGATPNPASPGAKPVITQNNDVRLFVAARIIDLTGLVNVNTASDFLDPPGDQDEIVPPSSVPYDNKKAFLAAGASPADVDLRRLLMLTDITHQYRGLGSGGGGGGYSYFPQPTPANVNDPADYSKYDDNASDATLSGEGAFEALRLARLRLALPSTATIPTLGTTPKDMAERVVGRFFAYEGVAAEPMGAARAGTNDLRIGSLFGLDDELELRTFAGLNDPGTTSRLERATGGRGNGAAYNPLRDTRPAEIERRGRDVAFTGPGRAPNVTPSSDSDRALFAATQEIRSKLTTVSGARRFTTDWTTTLPAPAAPAGQPGLTLETADQPIGIPKLLKDFEIGSDELVGGTTGILDVAKTRELFETYVGALAPYLDTSDRSWPILNAATGVRQPGITFFDTLAYGASAEVALRAAAHMTANFIDAVDHEAPLAGTGDQHIPTALLVDFVNPANQTPATLPVELQLVKHLTDTSGLGGATTSLADKLAPNLQRASNQNLVVFGIEAQPVLVEAATYAVFTDAPEGSPVVNGNNETLNTDVDIEGDVRASNPDFLFELIAFKLTNPSGEKLTLFSGAGASDYYFEYADRFFIVKHATGSTSSGPIELDPGQTLVLYCLSPETLTQAAERVSNALRGASWNTVYPSYTSTDLQLWLDRQLGTPAGTATARKPIQIPLGRPDTMEQVSFANRMGTFGSAGIHQLVDIQGESNGEAISGTPLLGVGQWPSANTNTRRVVNFWRRTKIGDPEGDGTLGSPNNPINDYLVDRLRDPVVAGNPGTTTPTLLVRPPSSGQNNVSGTDAGDENSAAAREDNTGFTAVIFGAIRRPSDRDAFIGTQARRGMFPPYAIEAKLDNSAGRISQNGYQKGPTDPGSKGDYVPSPPGGMGPRWRELGDAIKTGETSTGGMNSEIGEIVEKSLPDLATTATDPAGNILAIRPSEVKTPRIDLVPSRKRSASTPGTTAGKSYPDVAVEIRSLPSTGGGPAVKAMFSRASDMLTPLAIGPTLNPAAMPGLDGVTVQSMGNARAEGLEGAWLTLGEAVAMASDYYTPPQDRQFGIPNEKYLEFSEVTLYNFAREVPDANLATRVLPFARRGRLVLDDFVPYIKRTGPFNIRMFKGTNSLPTPGADETIGASIPLALTLLDRFSPSLARERKTAAAELSSDIEGPESLGRLVPGLININTAPLAVLRLLPLLAPDPQSPPTGGGPPIPKPWVQELPNGAAALGPLPGGTAPPSTQLYDLNNPAADTFDIASTFLAYRDKSHVLTRPSPSVFSAATAAEINLSGSNGRSDFSATAFSNPRIQGLRQQRGFASVGEVLAVNLRQEDLTFVGPAANVITDRNNSISRFGFDEARTDFDGLDPARFKTGTAAFGSSDNGDTEAEATSIADAILKTITVRSDVFCVYFLIHGYTPEDVKVGSDPKTPMVPSLQRRYVMVVDRSNVVSSDISVPAGQRKPRILMLRQVPER